MLRFVYWELCIVFVLFCNFVALTPGVCALYPMSGFDSKLNLNSLSFWAAVDNKCEPRRHCRVQIQ